MSEQHPYAKLTPDLVLDAIERFGFVCDGGLLPLSSYENRVYLAGTEEGDGAVAKFYRPGRWTDAAILEEHAFAQELAEREIPVVAPMDQPAALADEARIGPSLIEHGGFRVAVYERLRGHPPELDDPQTLEWVGRFLGRIHAVAATRSFAHRPTLDVPTFGTEPLEEMLESDLLPFEIRSRYEDAARALLEDIEQRLDAHGPARQIRLHGDCHHGNILWSPTGPHFVDLDDCRTGPAVQDLWMLLSGEPHEMEGQLAALLRGYRQFHDFDDRELALIELLRGLRAVYYSSWLAKRWEDPALPIAFPWFGSPRYWEDQTRDLEDQRERFDLVLHVH